MSETPWGDASQLRARMLRPGPGQSPELVAQNQRERLLAATVVAVAERGYEQTPVAELLKLSGISRTTFYQHFPGGKEEAFLAAVDAAMETGLAAVREACEGAGSWEQQVARGFDALAGAIAEQPAAAHLCLVDVHAAGAAGLAHAEEATSNFSWLLTQALGRSPKRAAVPPAITSAIAGGMRTVLETRIGRGELGGIAALMPGLCEWALSYGNPPTPLRRPRSRPPARRRGGEVRGPRCARRWRPTSRSSPPSRPGRGSPPSTCSPPARPASSTATGRSRCSRRSCSPVTRSPRAVGPVATEAIGGAVHALMREQIRRRGAEHLSQILPAATFVALKKI